jgi:hypothetical protein
MGDKLLVQESEWSIRFMREIVLCVLVGSGIALVMYLKLRRKRIRQLIDCRQLRQAASKYV